MIVGFIGMKSLSIFSKIIPAILLKKYKIYEGPFNHQT